MPSWFVPVPSAGRWPEFGHGAMRDGGIRRVWVHVGRLKKEQLGWKCKGICVKAGRDRRWRRAPRLRARRNNAGSRRWLNRG